MDQKNAFLGTEPIGRLLFRLAIPTVIAQLVNMLYNIVDRIYIGHMPQVGSLALTGLGVCTPIILIVSAFAALVASGGAPRASISMGKGDLQTAEKMLGGCFSLQLGISAVLTAALLIWNRDLLLAFGASGQTIDYAADYMQIYAIGTVFVQLTLGMNAFITAQGFAREGMLTVLIGAVCNIVLDPILIFRLGMGVRGAAIGSRQCGLRQQFADMGGFVTDPAGGDRRPGRDGHRMQFRGQDRRDRRKGGRIAAHRACRRWIGGA